MDEEYAAYYGNRQKYLNNKNPKIEAKEEKNKTSSTKKQENKKTSTKEAKTSKTTTKKQVTKKTSTKKEEPKKKAIIGEVLTSDTIKKIIKANPNMKEF